MSSRMVFIVALVALVSFSGHAARRLRGGELQGRSPAGQTNDPFPQPIVRDQGVITVTLREFASLPDIDGVAARMMTLVEEPTTRRLFVSDMRGLLYVVSADGKTVTPYLDLSDPKWGVAVQSQGRERGMQSFVLHPQFAQAGTPGFGKLYTYTDTSNQAPAPDFTTPNPSSTHDTVLLEWTAKTPGAATYDGGAPRELIRLRQPFANHNGGAIAFNSTARPGAAEFGLLYMGIADGGSGGDPMNAGAESRFRVRQGLPHRPARQERPRRQVRDPRGESVSCRQRAPCRKSSRMASAIRSALAGIPGMARCIMSDIGQNIVEEVSPVTAGANLGWNVWEGSYRFVSRAGGDHGSAAQRSEGHLSHRRMGSARSGPAVQQLIRLGRRDRLPEHHRSRSSLVGCSSATCRAASCFT